MKFHLTILLLAISFSVFGQNERNDTLTNILDIEESKTFYESGQLKSIGHYVNNRKEGVWLEYYENGQIHRRYYATNGEEHGLVVNYYEDGGVCIEYFKLNGEIHGEYRLYDYDGNLVRIEYWKNGKMSSDESKIFKEWEIDGTVDYKFLDGELKEMIWENGEQKIKN